jgi:NADP-dependent aldehyde dehydrogenase
MPNTITGQHLIAGQWRAGGMKFSAANPATGEALTPQFAEATESDVNAAAAAADEAFQQSVDLPSRWTADLLDAIASHIMDLGDALLERAEQETALPRARLSGERTRTVNQLKMFALIVRDGSWVEAVLDRADPKRTPPRPDLRRMLRPRGPVVVFGASNFPFAFSAVGGDTASALAAGNPVIVKGHPSHPGTSELFAAAVLAALKQTNLPLGLFALLQGRSHELSGWLVKHPSVQAVGFTGSQKAGRALFDMAAARPKPIPVYAEMGSLNPTVLMPGAIAERAADIAKGLAASLMLGGGQFCTKPGVVLVIDRDDTNKFVELLAQQVAQTQTVTMLNAGLRDGFCGRAEIVSQIAGVKAVVSGKGSGYASTSPSLFETTADVFRREPHLRDEAFGPAGLLIRCRDINELIVCLDEIGGSLTGTIHVGSSDREQDTRQVLRELEAIAGRVIVNSYPTGVEVNHAIVHGGPYPATTDAGSTSVGSAAIRRFARMIAFQDTPDHLLPPELQDANPLKIERLVDGKRTDAAIDRI